MAFGFGFGFTRNYVAALFSPASLFANGEQGTWYEPSDLTTLFQDSAGTTPVTAVQQPVGLMLDKSKGLVLGSQLNLGTVNTVAGTWTQSAGVVTASGLADASSVSFNLSAPTVVGRWYEINIQASVSGGSYYVDLGPGTSASQVGNLSGGLLFRLLANNATSLIRVGRWSGSTAGTIGPISIRELPGNHAFQTTSASRPVLSARYNLLTKTEQFNDGVWAKGFATAATSNKVTASTNTTVEYLQVLQTLSKDTASRTYVATIEAKEAELRYLGATLQEPLSGANGIFVHTDLRNASQTNQGSFGSGFTLTSVERTLLSDGYCRIVITATTNANATITFGVQPSKNSTFSSTTYIAGEGVLVRNSDLRVSNDALGQPAYQRVNTSTDYDTVGFKPYLAFDGVDDSLVTNSIDFTATDKMTVFAGVRKLSDAVAIFYETSVSASANTGAIVATTGLDTGAAGTLNGYLAAARGSAVYTGQAAAQSEPIAAPDTSVITATHDIAGDLSTIRRNGVAGTNGTGDKGTGNFGNYPLFIGRRNNTSLPFNGRLYSLIVRGAASTTAQITSTETYVNQKTGAYT